MEQLSYQKLTKRQRAATVLAQPWHFVFGNNSPLINLARRVRPSQPPRASATYIPAAPMFYNWGGFYLGINGGYGFGSSNWTGGAASSGSFSTDGFLVGVTLGANYQMGARSC